MLGLELLDAGAIAVTLDGAGLVSARADAADVNLALAAVSGRTRRSKSISGEVGLASVNPESPASVAAMSAIAARFRGARPMAVASGVAAAAAEAWSGAARGASDVVYFGVGEHPIAGILRNGVPFTGFRGRAATAAWLALNPVEREDYRKMGCLEAEVAASGIVRRLVWRIKAGDHSQAANAVNGDLAALSVQHVLEAARHGDGLAISVMRDTAKYLGMAAANLVAVTDPEVLVLGGIMASAADLLLEPVKTEIARRLPAPMMRALALRTALLGVDAAAIGAARLAASAAP